MENRTESVLNEKSSEKGAVFGQNVSSTENEDIEEPAVYRRPKICTRQTSAQVAETEKKDNPFDNSLEELRKTERRIARNFSLVKKDEDKDLVTCIFDHLHKLINSPEFDLIQDDMITCFPNFEEEIRKGKADLSRKDLCVIIAGETSAGKSTLINRLVGQQIFTPDVSETTSTICRVRNSGNKNQIECKIFGTDNQVLEEKTFPKGSEVSMKEFLQEYVDERPATSSIYIDHVDVSLSVPFLKGNTMIVDTPGIGGSKDLEVKMMEYLRNATSFVFVMSVVSAGGLQEDRLIKILQAVMKLHDEQDIPCFDPRDALFVSNKWDAVHKEQCEKTWRKIQEKLKTCWPSFSSENVFRTALDPPQKVENMREFQKEFQRFEKSLSDVIEKNHYARRLKHIRFLEDIAKEMDIRVKGRLHYISLSRDNCVEKINSMYSEALCLEKNAKQKKQELCDMISQELEKLSERLHTFLWSIDSKNCILNPPNKKRIMSVRYHKLEKKVGKRMRDYICEWQRGAEVVTVIGSIVDRITLSFSEIQHKIKEIEKAVKGSPKENQKGDQQQSYYQTPLLIGAVATAPLWIPILAAAGTLCALAGFVLSPMLILKIREWSKEEKKADVINEAFKEIRAQYTTDKIKSELEDMYGSHYRKLVKRLFAETTYKQIENLLETISRLEKERGSYLGKKKELEFLQDKIETIQRLASVEIKNLFDYRDEDTKL